MARETSSPTTFVNYAEKSPSQTNLKDYDPESGMLPSAPAPSFLTGKEEKAPISGEKGLSGRKVISSSSTSLSSGDDLDDNGAGHQQSDMPTPPDGGFRAWLMCFLGWMVNLSTWGFVYSFGAFQSYYSKALLANYSPSLISCIGSVQAFLISCAGLFSGRALDAGHFKKTFALGVVFQIFGMFMMSVSTKYWHLLLSHGICTGLGGGIMYTPATGLVSTYFSGNRAIALGITSTGNAVGGLLYPLVVRQCINKLGFAWTARLLAFFNIIPLTAALIFLTPRYTPKVKTTFLDLSALKDLPFMMITFGACFLTCPFYFVLNYIPTFGEKNFGLSYENSLNLLMILNGCGIVSRTLPAIFADKYFGVLNTIGPLAFGSAIILLCWPALGYSMQPVLNPRPAWSYYLFVLILGLVTAGFQGLFPVTLTKLTPDLTRVGSRMGLAFTFVGAASVLGGPIGGVLLSSVPASRAFLPAQIWTGGSTLMGALLICLSRGVKFGWTLRKRC